MLQNQKGLWNFSKISNSQNYLYSLPFFQKYHNCPIYFFYFHHLLRLIIFLLPKKVVGTSFFKIQIESYVQKREPRIHLLKKKRRKEVKEDPNSMAYGKFQWLVALKRFHYLVALRRFQCLVAPWKVPMFGGQWKEKETPFSPLLTFSPTNFT